MLSGFNRANEALCPLWSAADIKCALRDVRLVPLADVEHLAILLAGMVHRRALAFNARGPTPHGEAGDAKLAGFNVPTQEMSGASGSARNDTTTSCAQGDAGGTKCPMPGMLMMVALARLAAAALAPARDVSVSKLPEMRSVEMPLSTGRCMASGAAGTFQTSRQSSLKYAQLPIPSRCIDAG